MIYFKIIVYSSIFVKFVEKKNMGFQQDYLRKWIKKEFDSQIECSDYLGFNNTQALQHYFKEGKVLADELIVKLESKGFDRELYLNGKELNVIPVLPVAIDLLNNMSAIQITEFFNTQVKPLHDRLKPIAEAYEGVS